MANSPPTESAYVTRMTVGGAVNHRDCKSETMEVRYSKTRGTIYLPNGVVLKKLKGGHKGGVMKGQYECQDTGDTYNVMTR